MSARSGPQARPTALDEFMAYQVMHAKQVESKKHVLAAAAQVDDMYDMLAAYEQKVSCTHHSSTNQPPSLTWSIGMLRILPTN